MKQILTLLPALGALTMTGVGAPLDRHDVSATPALLAHVDVDALRSTSVGKAVLADADVQTKLGAVQAAFNFDFRTQLHGLTIYTTTDHADEPVLIIYADFEPDRLIALARAFPGFGAETNDARVVYSWTDEKKKNSDARIYASLTKNRLIFGKNGTVLAAALDVIDGKADSYINGKQLLEAAPGELIVAQGLALKFKVDDNDAHAEIFKASKSVRAQIGEQGDAVTAKVRFDAKDEDSANQITAMVNGLIAFLRFQKDNPDLLKLANGINIKQDGIAVTLNASAPSGDIVSLLQKGADKAREKHERRSDDADTNAPAPGKNP
jgi:hypothetical protein